VLKAYGNPKAARADFVRFLSGEFSPRFLQEVQFWVVEEQEGKAPFLIDEEYLAPQSNSHRTDSGQLVGITKVPTRPPYRRGVQRHEP
jgi:hypothetical protein